MDAEHLPNESDAGAVSMCRKSVGCSKEKDLSNRYGELASDSICTALGYHRYDEEGQGTEKTALLRAQARLRQREMDKLESLASHALSTLPVNRRNGSLWSANVFCAAYNIDLTVIVSGHSAIYDFNCKTGDEPRCTA
ncbi:hypothetical protein V1T76_09340 [Roseibium sp. FZY0029]|uniref:hypothetical protein n=1 Tax=Roseibium sp. FZY0029 TaxID=3116647 RepID=UPI002EABD0F2|nr:hypothetical protein [Roseibium sp. FZY0029]